MIQADRDQIAIITAPEPLYVEHRSIVDQLDTSRQVVIESGSSKLKRQTPSSEFMAAWADR